MKMVWNGNEGSVTSFPGARTRPSHTDELGCFCASKAELRSRDRDHMAGKVMPTYCPALHRASVPTPILSPPCDLQVLLPSLAQNIHHLREESGAIPAPPVLPLGLAGGPQPAGPWPLLPCITFDKHASLEAPSVMAQIVKKIHLQCRKPGFNPRVREIPCRRE